MTSFAKSNDSDGSNTLCMKSKVMQKVIVNYEE